MTDAAALEQLRGEARAVDESLKATQGIPREEGAPPGAGAAASSQAAPEAERPSEGAAGGAPEGEVVKNPAPSIRALLEMVRDVPMVRALLPQAFIAALDDAAIAELAEAFGDVAVKYRIDLGGALGERWKVELRAALALGSVAFNIWRAKHADDDAARAARAREVSPAAPGDVDPPNPAAGQKPVEPGA